MDRLTVMNQARKVTTVLVENRTMHSLLLLVMASVVLSHLVFLTKYPPVFIDEPWYANAAWNWLETGRNFDPMHAEARPSNEWGYLSNVSWVISFALLGPSFFQARLVSWFFGIVLLLAVIGVGRRSYGTTTGLLAALMLSLSLAFLQASHYARPDIILAAVVVGAYYFANVALDRERWWAHVLAGLLLGITPDIHLNGVILALGLVAVYLITYGRKVLRRSGTWLFVAGGLLGLLYYAGVRVLPNMGTFFARYDLAMGATHTPPLFTLSPVVLAKSAVQEIGRYHFYDYSLDFALIGASALYLLARRSPADRRLLAFVGTAFLGFVLFVGNKHDVYAILFYPFFLLMVAEAFVSLLRAGRGLAPQRLFVGALLLLFLLNSAVHVARPVLASRDYDYEAITDQIRTVVPEGARVMGMPHWWLGLADHDYRSSLSLTYYHFYNGYSLTEGLEAIRPDVVIVDSAQRGLWVDEGCFPPGPGFEIYKLPRQEFEEFLAERGEKVLEFSDRWHGKFEVYGIRWKD